MTPDLNKTALKGKVGPSLSADGSDIAARFSRTGALVVVQAHGRFAEATSRGKFFHASTAVGGVAPGTALSTTPPLALWNPEKSGVLLAIKQVALGYVSGTLGAGTMVHAQVVGQTTAPSGGSNLPIARGLLNGILSSGSCAIACQGSTLAATPTIIRPSTVLGAFVGGAGNLCPPLIDEVDGSILITPGTVWVYQGIAAAGTSPLVLLSVSWEEILIP